MSRNFKPKGKWRSIIAAVVVIGLIIASCAFVASFTKKETKTIGAGVFLRGDLDSNGVYVESSQSLYTKEAFGCRGLRIEPDFEFQGTYDVYYYDYNGHFLGSETDLDAIYDVDYPVAKLARVVIHPAIPDDVKEKDFKINFWEVYGYAKNLKITVDKDQEWKYETDNLYDSVDIIEHMSFTDQTVGTNYTESVVSGDNLQSKVTEKIAVEYNTYDIYVKYAEIREFWTFGIAATAGDIITATECHACLDAEVGEWVMITLEIPEDSPYGETDHIRVRLPLTAECYIYGYNS